MKSLLLRGFPLVLIAFLLAAPDGIAQQQPTPAPRDTAARDTAPAGPKRPSPRSAFLRSLLVPGWGQFSFGSYTRGAVFATLQAGSAFMLVKTMGTLSDARDREREQVGIARDSILGEAATDTLLAKALQENPDTLDFLIGRDPDVDDARELENAREQQREDWITLLVFWTLASGVDAFVNAHLADFPAQIRVAPHAGGRTDIGVRVFPGRRW